MDPVGEFIQGYQQGRSNKYAREMDKLRLQIIKSQMALKQTQQDAQNDLISMLTEGIVKPEDMKGTYLPPNLQGPVRPMPEPKPVTIREALSTPQGQALALRSGMSVNDIRGMSSPNILEMLSQIPGMSGGGGQAGNFEMSGFKLGPNGQLMPDFSRVEIYKEIPSPDGRSMLQIDRLGRTIGARPVGPSERPEAERVKERERAQKEVKMESAQDLLRQLETLYENIVSSKDLPSRAANTKIYDDFVSGSIAPLVRALGESGALATEDIQRALKLPPSAMTAYTPYTTSIGRTKFSELRKLLKIPNENKNSQGVGRVIDFNDLPKRK